MRGALVLVARCVFELRGAFGLWGVVEGREEGGGLEGTSTVRSVIDHGLWLRRDMEEEEVGRGSIGGRLLGGDAGVQGRT